MKNSPANSLMYGIVGSLIGGFVVWLLMMSVVNNNSTGMMQMRGMHNNMGMTGTMDRHFIEQMIPHHEGAIDMAMLAFERSNRAEIKTLARNIIQSQTAEINMMKKWYESWYGTVVPENSEIGMSRRMMHGGMMDDNLDTNALINVSDFDKAFIEEMIPHHQMAIMMANMLLQGTDRSEMKQLGKNIIDAQTSEINQMQSWYGDWYK